MKHPIDASPPRTSDDSPGASLPTTPQTSSKVDTPETSSDGIDQSGLVFEHREQHQGHRGDQSRGSLGSIRPFSSDLELGDMHAEDPQDNEEAGLTAGLKGEEFRHQRGSIAPDGRPSLESVEDIWVEARRLGKAVFIRKALINGTLIGLWYLFSICISVYNKWMFSPDNLDFHFPMFTTSLHMIVQFLGAALILSLFPKFRPRQAMQDAHDKAIQSGSRDELPDPKKPIMTPWFYLTRVASTGSVTGLDIGLGNSSLKFVTLTFFTMCKSSTLGFVLFFAIFFRLEKPSWKIGLIILLMTVGVVMMVAGETAFNAVGFAMLMAASFCSGIRWSLTQMLLRRTPSTSNPFSTLFFLTPVMFLTLFILAIPMEGFGELKVGLETLADKKGLLFGMCILLFPGFLAFCMVSAEFALLKRTSVVTLSVCGIFKEVLTITAAGLVFGDQLTPINISGLIVTIIAIVIYNWIRMQKMKKQEIKKAVEIVEEHAPIYDATIHMDDDADSDLPDGRPSGGDRRLSLNGSTGISPQPQNEDSALSPSRSRRNQDWD